MKCVNRSDVSLWNYGFGEECDDGPDDQWPLGSSPAEEAEESDYKEGRANNGHGTED
jgi:hypothetical protein